MELEFAGEIVERQELLNGTESVTIDATSPDGGWTLNATVSWNLGILDYTGEGDLTLARPGGWELYGTLIHARPQRGDTFEWIIEATFEIDGGTDAWAGARGAVAARFDLSAGEATVAVTLNLVET